MEKEGRRENFGATLGFKEDEIMLTKKTIDIKISNGRI